MNEITKLYENAGIPKYGKRQCKDSEYLECQNYCFCNMDNKCDKFTFEYPPFTAEKQLEICKFLLKVEHSISYYFYENRYGFVIDDKQDDCIEAEKFETALAMIVNNLWQDLSEEEKQQVKRILK